ncbi:hypothetical protein, partial [Rhizobium leguminosarum]|uniref:hypothetical protein n=1 Tax=Rhizobium leguminosarum TaxID=384 RepID=UPI001C9285CA
ESNHDLPRLENPQTSNHFSKRAVMHTSMTAHQNAAMDFAPRTLSAIPSSAVVEFDELSTASNSQLPDPRVKRTDLGAGLNVRKKATACIL